MSKRKYLVEMKQEQAVCTSLDVAEAFGKEHKNVLRDIEGLIKKLSELKIELRKNIYFQESAYKDSSGKSNKMYYMNRNAFSFLVMGFTGDTALIWKAKYIQAFDKMEDYIRVHKTQEYINLRNEGKLARRDETDAIKLLIGYAKAQGSKHPEKLYTVYSKLANQITGIPDRRFMTPDEARRVAIVESCIKHIIIQDMEKRMYYKDIYKDCKSRLIADSNIIFLTISDTMRLSEGGAYAKSH